MICVDACHAERVTSQCLLDRHPMQIVFSESMKLHVQRGWELVSGTQNIVSVYAD